MENETLEILKALGTWLGIIVQIAGFLIALFLLWRSNKKDFKYLGETILSFKTNIEKELTRHENEIKDITPIISIAQSDIKKNCQAVKDMQKRIDDMKNDCRDRHVGVVHEFVR